MSFYAFAGSGELSVDEQTGGEQCQPGRDCNCNRYPQSCGAGESLGSDEAPRAHCPKWEVSA